MRGLAVSFALLLALSAPGCRSKSSPEPGPTGSASAALASAASAASFEDPPPAGGPRNTARLARCGWGPLKVNPGVDAPPWAIALVDVDVMHATKGLRVVMLELAGSEIVAKSGERKTLRVQDGAVRYSFTAAETHEIDEELPVGSWRIRAASALDRPAKAILSRKPTRCTVELAEASGEELVASGSVDPMWENE